MTSSPKLPLAVQLVADDRLSDEEIAALLGVNRATLHRWKKKPLFVEQVSAIRSRAALVLETQSLKEREVRIAQAQARHDAIATTVQERAVHDDYQDVPGGKTGWIVRKERMIGTGPKAELTVEYAVALDEMNHQLAEEKRIAQEMGQWSEKSDVNVTGQIQNNVIFYLPEKDALPDLTPLPKVIEHEG